MHLHILGICGTFMGGLAAVAREAGHRVTGCDEAVYPPMSEQLRTLGIELIEGYGADQMKLAPDLFVVGNNIKRGNPLMEALLDSGGEKSVQFRPMRVVALRVWLPDKRFARPLGAHERIFTTDKKDIVLPEQGIEFLLRCKRNGLADKAVRQVFRRTNVFLNHGCQRAFRDGASHMHRRIAHCRDQRPGCGIAISKEENLQMICLARRYCSFARGKQIPLADQSPSVREKSGKEKILG